MAEQALPSSDQDDAAAAPWDETRPDTEQRATARFTLLIRTAKLIGRSGEYLCVVRDVSSEGVKARLFHPLPRGEALAIELASGERHAIERIWEEGEITGFRFLAPVALDRLLADAPDGRKKRPVRLRLELPATLVAQGRRLDASFRDISQHGASIACEEYLAMDERVRVDCDWLPPLDARVRWRRRPHYGLIFEQTFRFDELARMTAPLQFADEAAPPARRARFG
jgi:hypothetical protein